MKSEGQREGAKGEGWRKGREGQREGGREQGRKEGGEDEGGGGEQRSILLRQS